MSSFDEAATAQVPVQVLGALAGESSTVLDIASAPLTGSTGAATAAVDLLTLTIEDPAGEVTTHRVIRKQLQPLTSGRHAEASRAPDHWAYWRREALAYGSDLLPTGPGLAAPRLLGLDGDTLYTDAVAGERENPSTAVERLGRWQSATPVPDIPWLARDQLAQRVAVTSLDWRGLDVDERLIRIWDGRDAMLDELATLPATVVHGDFSAGNLLRLDAATTVAIDWATFGVGPVGADLASLTLSTGEDHLEAYLDSLGPRFPRAAVVRGYQIALGLTHASRVHWSLSQGIRPDRSLTELVLRVVASA